MDNSAAVARLAALSQRTRLDIFRLLVRAGPDGRAAGEIADALQARQNTVSSHLKQLTIAGLVHRERVGRRVVYRADFDTMRELVLFLIEDCCAGDANVCEPVAATLAAARTAGRCG